MNQEKIDDLTMFDYNINEADKSSLNWHKYVHFIIFMLNLAIGKLLNI